LLQNEVKAMYILDHPNIVKFFSWYETTNHIWVIIEHCSGGDLKSLLNQDKRLPEDSIRAFSTDVRAGLLFVHSKDIIYGDLKPQSVLFDGIGTMKLCDFKQSLKFEESLPQTVYFYSILKLCLNNR
jgi:serine/threonine-protein kinase ULK4